jgi:hypothetical protein
MRHRVDAWLAVMSNEPLSIHFAANPAAETITPQHVIKQAVKILAGMALAPFAALTEPAS